LNAFSGLLFKNGDASTFKMLNRGVVTGVRTADWVAAVYQNFCQRRHPNTAYTDEMNRCLGREQAWQRTATKG
jgi:hypothetical protein